jgi:FAS-associated factor 2
MLDGERVIRKFAANVTMEELYAFVECQDTLQAGELDDEEEVKQPAGFRHEYKFRLVTPMPREAYELDAGGTIKERIGRSGNLIVEKTEMDDSDEEEDEDVEE